MTRSRVWLAAAFVAAVGLGLAVGRLSVPKPQPVAEDSAPAPAAMTGPRAQAAEALEALGQMHRSLGQRAPSAVSTDILAARLAGLGPEAAPELVGALHDESDWVREASALALGKLGLEQAVAPLLRAPEREPRPKAETLARALADLGDVVRPSATAALADPHPGVREVAALTLGRLGDGRSVEALVSELRSPHGSTGCILEALREAGHPRAVPALAAHVRSSSGARSETAIEALGETRSTDAVPVLVECLSNPGIAQNACLALGKMGDPAAVPALIKMLDPSAWGRSGSAFHEAGMPARALANIGDPAAIRPLAELLGQAEDSEALPLDVAMEVAAALGSFGEPGLAELRKMLKSDSADVAGAAAYGLAEAGDASGLPELIAAPTDGAASMMKDGGLLTLARRRPHEVAAALDPTATPAETRHRVAACLAFAFREWSDEGPGEPVRRALIRAARSDPDQSVREAAQKALDQLPSSAY